jgi:hypothetical protein
MPHSCGFLQGWGFCLGLRAPSFGVGDPNDDALAERRSRAGNGIERHGDVLRVEQPIELRAAGAKLFRQGEFRLLLPVH